MKELTCVNCDCAFEAGEHVVDPVCTICGAEQGTNDGFKPKDAPGGTNNGPMDLSALDDWNPYGAD